MDDPRSPQLHYVFSQRLDDLAARLAGDLAARPLRDPLAEEVIVVPHPGMGRWLQQRLAEHWGIAAQLRLPLPARFVRDTAARLSGDRISDAAFDPGALAWRIQALLPGLIDQAAFAPVADYLADQSPLKAYELAQRLADTYDRYLVYRPDWLQIWQRGKSVVADGPNAVWQAALWRRLREDINAPAHSEALREATALLAAGRFTDAVLPPRIAVFGVSTLPPLYLQFFAALAGQRQLVWYHLNPSAHYWGDIRSRREIARIEARARSAGTDAQHYLEEGHPLLASWGRLGREFLSALYDMPGLAIDDVELRQAPGPDSVLGWLQRGILELDPDSPPPEIDGQALNVQVHSCQTRQREIEVLHDCLLDLFERTPGLSPRDVVVMSPRIDDYVAAIDAVFGTAAESRRLPYTIADRSESSQHAVVRAFLHVLALPEWRFTATEVLDLLAVPAVARSLRIGDEALARIRDWVADTRVRWGIDAAFRAECGAGAYDEYGWRAALDRLLMGYAAGADLDFVAGVRPYPDIEGPSAIALGVLDRTLDRLRDWRARLAQPRSAENWRETIGNLLGEFFDYEDLNPDDASGISSVTAAVSAWVTEIYAGAAQDLRVAPIVVRAELDRRLREPQRQQRFLGAGVTFCAMVPMRSVPFRVVCLLGLNDGEFPRRDPRDAFDLMRDKRRLGDRSPRDDDRYLFLEALLAARDHLHLSYLGVDPRDLSARPPASVLAETMDFIVGRYPSDRQPVVHQALVQRHPLAAYAAPNFDPASRAHSFAAEWLAPSRAAAGPRAGAPRFATPLARAAVATDGAIEVDRLFEFFRDPSRYFCRRVLQLTLPTEETLADDEPFSLDLLDRYGLRERLIAALIADPRSAGAADVWFERLRAESLLPPGTLARAAFDPAFALAVDASDAVAHALPGIAALAPASIDVQRGELRILGSIGGRSTQGLFRVRAGSMRGGDWMILALGSVLLREAGVATADPWALSVDSSAVQLERLDLGADSASWMDAMVQAFRVGQTQAPPLYRHASWAYARSYAKYADPERALNAALSRWQGSAWGGAGFVEVDDPHVALLTQGIDNPLDAAFVDCAQALLVPLARSVEALAP